MRTTIHNRPPNENPDQHPEGNPQAEPVDPYRDEGNRPQATCSYKLTK